MLVPDLYGRKRRRRGQKRPHRHHPGPQEPPHIDIIIHQNDQHAKPNFLVVLPDPMSLTQPSGGPRQADMA